MIHGTPTAAHSVSPLPTSVLSDIVPCVGPRKIVLQYPNLVVGSQQRGSSVTLRVALLSHEATDGDLGHGGEPLRAFVSIDSRTIILGLTPQARTTLSFGPLEHGRHVLLYGVYSGARLLNGNTRCFST